VQKSAYMVAQNKSGRSGIDRRAAGEAEVLAIRGETRAALRRGLAASTGLWRASLGPNMIVRQFVDRAERGEGAPGALTADEPRNIKFRLT
jgi:hypothetical protein